MSRILLITSASSASNNPNHNYPYYNHQDQFTDLSVGNGAEGNGAENGAFGFYDNSPAIDSSSYDGSYQQGSGGGFVNFGYEDPANDESEFADINDFQYPGDQYGQGFSGAQQAVQAPQEGFEKCDEQARCVGPDAFCTKRVVDTDSGLDQGVCRKCDTQPLFGSKNYKKFLYLHNHGGWRKKTCQRGHGERGVDGYPVVKVDNVALYMGLKQQRDSRVKVYNMHSGPESVPWYEATEVLDDEIVRDIIRRLSGVHGTMQKIKTFKYPGSVIKYTLFEKLDRDLKRHMTRLSNFNRRVKGGLIMLYDVVTALKGIHSKRVYHGDVGPDTIGLSIRPSFDQTDRTFFKLGDYTAEFAHQSQQATYGRSDESSRCDPFWRSEFQRDPRNQGRYVQSDDVECAMLTLREYLAGDHFGEVSGGRERVSAIDRGDHISWCSAENQARADDNNSARADNRYVQAWVQVCEGIMKTIYPRGIIPGNEPGPDEDYHKVILDIISEAYASLDHSMSRVADNLAGMSWIDKSTVLGELRSN